MNHLPPHPPSKILQLFAAEESAELTAHWQRFLGLQSTPQDPIFVLDAFIRYLAEQSLFDLSKIEALHFQEPVEMLQTQPAVYSHLAHPNTITPPQNNRHYVFEKELGQGAMGVVYQAHDRILGRHVAYKALLSQSQLPPRVVQRFINEVQITAQLDHPHIVPVYRMSYQEQGLPTYTMKKISGFTLKALLSQTRQALDQGLAPPYSREALLQLFLKVCDAMGFAHARQVIHRDLKPANLMIGAYQDVYVMDWGIARRFGENEALRELHSDDFQHPEMTQAGQILGTPRYMSPQQAAARNHLLDGRSDIFALGLILFEILTLKPAIQAGDQMGLLKQVLQAQLAPFVPYAKHTQAKAAGFSQVEAPLQAIVHKACARKEADRYAQAEHLAQDLRRFLAGEPVSVYQPPWWERALYQIQKHKNLSFALTATLILGLVLILVGSISYQLWNTQQARQLDAARALVISAGAQQAQALERELFAIEGHLESLSTRAAGALIQGKSIPEAHWYRYEAFDQGTVPGLENNARYQRAISFRYPVVKLAPGLSTAEAQSALKKLYILNPFFQQIFAQNPLMVWGYVSLENGLHYSYPGKGGYPTDYDPRRRPWYQEAQSHDTAFWGKPYEDISGLGSLLPRIMPLFDPQIHPPRRLGNVGVEMVLDDLIPHYLQLQHPAVEAVALVYRNQELLLAADNKTGQRLAHFELPAEVKHQLAAQRNGTLLQKAKTGPQLWSFFYLEVLDAYYMVKMNQDTLLQESQD